MAKSNTMTIIFAIIGLALGVFVGLALRSCNEEPQYTPVDSYTVAKDTAIPYIPKPIRIDSAKTKIKYVTRIVYRDIETNYTDTVFQPYYSDSLLITKPFIARLDTIALGDTIHAKFQYPENLFSIAINRSIDSVHFTWLDSIRVIERKRTFWDKVEDGALWLLGGLVVGGGVGIIIAK